MANTTNEQPKSLADQMKQAALGKNDNKPADTTPRSLNDGMYQVFGGQNPLPANKPQ